MDQVAPLTPTPVAAVTADEPVDQAAEAKKARQAMLRTKIDRCKKDRTLLVQAWSDNVDYRRGKPFAEKTDKDRVNVNLDWSFTKGKHAQLFSQMPQVYLTAKQKVYEPAIHGFGKQLNDTLTAAKVGSAVDESVLDAINAAGIGALLVSREAITEQVMMPQFDPQTTPPDLAAAIQAGTAQMPQIPSTRVVSEMYMCRRISPSDLIWDTGFQGSNFDDSNLIGNSGRLLWSEAKRLFKLKDEDKETIVGARTARTDLRQDVETPDDAEGIVEYDQLFYWAYRYDPEEKYYQKINHLVFVKGKTEPVMDGPWAGQKFDEQAKKYIGACKFPIRILTLTYISDDAIPPSDSAIGRPQVDEMIKSRSQIVMNRERSQPMRWANVDRIDPMVLDTIQRGEYQAIIPLQGDGSRSIGEVSRAAYPREDFEFDNVIKGDLQQQWQVSPNQIGSSNSSRTSASEANIVQQNFQTRIGYERSRVSAYVAGTAEVMGGLLALNGNFPILGQEELQAMDQSWDRKHIGNEYVYWIRPDDTVLLDSQQRIDRLTKALNIAGQSPFCNPKPILTEIMELIGLDPAEIMVDPKPKEPDDPNLSYRFSGAADLMNPVVMALLMKAGVAPSPEELTAAKNLLANASLPPALPAPPGMPVAGPPGPPMPPGAPPPPGPNVVGPANPEWGLQPKLAKRTEDLG